MTRITKVCKECGSTDVLADAYVAWNEDLQRYEIEALFEEKGSCCNNCEGETRIIDKEIEALIHFSLSDILKKSARQLCYLRKNPDKKPLPSQQMIAGNEHAHEIATSKYIEMRGTYKPDLKFTKEHGQFLMHYAFDEVHVNDKSALFIEHKNIGDESSIEMWYLESSILQTAVYQAFAKENPDRNLYTANFYVKEGNEKLKLSLNNLYERSELHLGDEHHYTVVATKTKELVAFCINKAIASLDWDTAQVFDDKYKFEEFNALKHCFTYRPIQNV